MTPDSNKRSAMKAVSCALFVAALVLSMSACGGGSSNGSNLNSNGSKSTDIGDSSINSIGGIGGGSSGSAIASTPVEAANIMISPSSPSVAVDGTTQLTATPKDSSAAPITWTSSAPGVATVDENGVATGIGAGTTQITASEGGMTSPPVVLTSCDFRHL